jgi:hypothetical protein
MEDSKQHIATMIAKAAQAEHADDAMRFSQAACNAANALCALKASAGFERPKLNVKK